MKQIIYTLSGAMLCVLIFAALLSVDARAVRENEMRTALSDAVEEAVEETHLAAIDRPLSNDELIALFEQLLLSRMNVNGDADGKGDPNLALTVDIAGADAEKGLLFVHVRETFTYPNGKTGTIEDTAQLLVEKESHRGMRTVTYRHTDAALALSEKNGAPMPRIIKIYQLEDGMNIPAPAGDWVLAETAENGDLTYIPRDEALHTDTERVYSSSELHLPGEKTASGTKDADPSLSKENAAGPEGSSALQPKAKDAAGEDDGDKETDEIIVAIIDTGLDLSVAAEPDNCLYGRLAAATDPSVTDTDGHGTAMASIIAAHTPAMVKLLPIKAFEGDGSGSVDDVCLALEKALGAGASVINLSFTGKGASPELKQLIRRATSQGVTVIAAAGNAGADVADYVPAGIEEAITVAAVDEDGSHPAYSNYGSAIDFAADGLARLPGASEDTADDTIYSGTSVAAAYASAYAALLLSAAVGEEIDIYASFLSSAADLGEPGWDSYFGNGYLSAEGLIYIAAEYRGSHEAAADPDEADAIPATRVGSGILLTHAAYPTKYMTYSTTTPIRLNDFGVGAKIRVAWDNGSGFNRNGGVSVSCNGSVSGGANYIDATSNDGNFSVTLNRFNFSRDGNYGMSHAIIISVTPGSKQGFNYLLAKRSSNAPAAYSYSADPVNSDYLYEPISAGQETAGSMLLPAQPIAYWTTTPEQTAIPARPNNSSGCTIFVAPSTDGRYYPAFHGLWSPKQTIVYYYGNGGTPTGDNSNKLPAGYGTQEGYFTTYSMEDGATGRYFNRSATRPGYIFKGWNTQADGSGKSYPAGLDLAEYTINNPKNISVLELYAQWRPATYTVRFSGTPTSLRKNNAKGFPYSTEPRGSMSDQVVNFDSSTALKANAFTRSGYLFAGWATSPQSDAAAYGDRGTVKNIISPDSGQTAVTLYAVWKPVTYQIRYHANGVNGGSAPTQTISYDSPFSLHANPFYQTVNGKRSASFVFNSYHVSPNASGGASYGVRSEIRNSASSLSDTPKSSWKSGERVYNLTAQNGKVIDLYAIWDVDFTLSLSADIRAGETNRTDLYKTGAFPYHLPDCNTVIYPHIGTMGGHNSGASNPYLRQTFVLPNAYPFIKEKTVTAQSRLHYDANKDAYTDYTFRYSQQGYSWYASNAKHPKTNAVTTYREADYVKGDYLTADPSQRRRLDGSTHQYFRWLLSAAESHPGNIAADASGYLTVTLYAVWDEAPVIDAYDRYFTTGELEDCLANGTLPTVLAAVDALRVRDREDGVLSNGTARGITHKNGTPAITSDLDTATLSALLGSGAERFSMSVTFRATDAVGNITFQTILVHVTSDTPIRSISGSGSYAASFVRGIDQKNYEKHTGSSTPADIRANENGALKPHSLWYENAAYKKTVTDAFAVIGRKSGYLYSKTFDSETIRAAQEYINTKGTGFTKADPGKLDRWMELFF